MKKFLRNIYVHVCDTCLVFYYQSCDFFYTLKNYRIFNINTKDKSASNIMLLMHSLEKGLSFVEKKQNWGAEKAMSLCQILDNYIKKYGVDKQVIVALNILNKYTLDEKSSKSPELRKYINNLLTTNSKYLDSSIGGVKNITKPNLDIKYEQLFRFCASRSSVRSFSSEPLTAEEIQNAISFAELTPSACNRQASRVHIVKDKNLINTLLKYQLGGQGWCQNADTLFLVTSISSYFGGLYERHQPFVDGGMFAMNLDLGLHVQGIASCFKMYIHDPKKDKHVRRIIKIPSNEIPIVLIFAGHYSNSVTLSPQSLRNKISYELL